MVPSNMREKKKGSTKCDKNIATCDVNATQYEDGTVKYEKKNKGITECDKSIVTCDVDIAQCNNGIVKCEEN